LHEKEFALCCRPLLKGAGQRRDCTYDRIARIDQGAEVDNKRLAHALEAARLLQAKRDDRRSCDAPSRTHRGEQVHAKKALEGMKKQRALSIADMNEAILEVSAKAMYANFGAPSLRG
jgi:hypothetical protein